MERIQTFWLALSVLLVCAEASKVLVVFPLPSRSHANLGDGIVRHLLNAGHEVTYITPFVYKNAPPNLRTIDVSSNFDVWPAHLITIKSIIEDPDAFANMNMMAFLVTTIMNHTYENEAVAALLNDSKEHFDAVIVEWIFNEAIGGIATIFDCPLIWMSSVEVHWKLLSLIDQPSNPAYSVDMTSSNQPPLSFTERVSELWTQIQISILSYFIFDKMQDETYQKYVVPAITKRGRDAPSFYEMKYNASLILANAYVSTAIPQTMPQSHKYIGGYHVDEVVKPLLEDKKLIESSKDGVIYFSLGSNLKSKDLPEEIRVSLLKMFGTLKQTVLWKFEANMTDLPPNVHILEWAPQQAILSHPKLAVFITHGGLLSTIESVHFGIPIIGIPVLADQHMNIKKAVRNGFALKVDLSYTMADQLKKAIIEVTSNSKYAQKAKELSFIHHDRPVKPGVELVHWVNHVINTHGAPHLRSPALHVPFYQKMYLDLAAVLIILFLAGRLLLKKAYAAVFSKSKSNKKKTH
uniref:UDP-glucuronosyltransferase n=1 Tax=Spodoptera littoralis TaxID=7109 RepID=A0A024AHN0_SPOLI|nr:UDP-glycosyltransferase 40U1 [Spodoptera littoralis]